jgi:hypothetical protein
MNPLSVGWRNQCSPRGFALQSENHIMITRQQWLWMICAPAMLGSVILALAWFRSPFAATSSMARQTVSERPLAIASTGLPLAGTGSCSARGCHGAIEPSPDREHCGQNEYLLWTQDRHADAYRVLFNERSQTIARLLGGQKKAHEDPRCLVCHTNPTLAALPVESPFLQEEKYFGVGCESCHGNANSWLVAHTASDWRVKKKASSMPDLSDASVAAKTCAGCHVGAAPDKDVPARDVNHDLIAAGHPRLSFEFGAYQANMPAHWRSKKKSDGHLWSVGQIVSAQASLELLTHRAQSGPWPEFAEYDCFACHRSLFGQQMDRRKSKPGTLPWGSWYFALTRGLVGELPALDALEKHLQRPYPARAPIVIKAKAALEELKTRQKSFSTAKDSDAIARQEVVERFKNGTLTIDPCWDGAEQMYLALWALNPSPALNELTLERSFAPGFDGPRNGQHPFQPALFLERLKRLPK